MSRNVKMSRSHEIQEGFEFREFKTLKNKHKINEQTICNMNKECLSCVYLKCSVRDASSTRFLFYFYFYGCCDETKF